jgi:hypothetical protein
VYLAIDVGARAAKALLVNATGAIVVTWCRKKSERSRKSSSASRSSIRSHDPVVRNGSTTS